MPTSEINSITTPEGTGQPVTHEDLIKIVRQMVQHEVMSFASVAERTAVFATLGVSAPVGALSHITATKAYEKWDGTAWIGALGAWTTYTPAWTASGTPPALLNGTLTGRWLRMNQLIIAELSLTMGSTTTFGTGVYFFSLPSTASASSIVFNAAGQAWALDAGVKETGGICKIEAGGTTFRISGAPIAAGTGDNWGQTVPFTWGSTDVLTARVMYEPA